MIFSLKVDFKKKINKMIKYKIMILKFKINLKKELKIFKKIQVNKLI